ncbi:MAG TPA: hypothetical protein VK095_01435 [Beutenbergiaceae bacterium]|nr:hypothetical protein [Beutenbergiaceae bacterium]
MSATQVYGPSPVKRRRRTNTELEEIDQAILTALEEENPATLRGTYYRVVSAGAIDKTEAAYKVIGRRVLALRRSGRLSYRWITDGTRYVTRPSDWNNVEQMLQVYSSSYRRALWVDQPVDVHLFCEKDAITGVIEPVTFDTYAVPVGVMRGYASESFCWKVAESLKFSTKPVIFYNLGDHDPSGVDVWRDFEEKVRGFAPRAEVTFERIAVTPGQIEQLNLPTRPTKKTDSRAAGFRGESVEVDAIPPRMLRQIVEEAVTRHMDQHQLQITKMVEDSEREWLRSLTVGGDSR